ncbi:hypothetical protein L1987_24205 [Smallanthus sonchifolius]|uniref:Uncharacterized protein n=1 Tax=Smallanthus sonchifolius TaxID=185202 RepID=A0ACB9IL84_9ASTR|nr:hypothetical protein L1987_24205 [Smallanthus sonchifolius]
MCVSVYLNTQRQIRSLVDKPCPRALGLPGNSRAMVVFLIGIAYQVITEGNEIDLRLEPSREKSGRQYSFSEKCPEWESNFWMKFASETLVTASLRDDECDVVFNLRLTVGLEFGRGFSATNRIRRSVCWGDQLVWAFCWRGRDEARDAFSSCRGAGNSPVEVSPENASDRRTNVGDNRNCELGFGRFSPCSLDLVLIFTHTAPSETPRPASTLAGDPYGIRKLSSPVSVPPSPSISSTWKWLDLE